MNGSSITGTNPIIITSGTQNVIITNENTKVKHFYWLQPDLSSTSSLVLRKGDISGTIYNTMKCEASGQSQMHKVDQWMDKLYCDMMPCGTLYIYKH